MKDILTYFIGALLIMAAVICFACENALVSAVGLVYSIALWRSGNTAIGRRFWRKFHKINFKIIHKIEHYEKA